VKIVEHVEGTTPCRHSARTWETALSGVMDCLGLAVSYVDEQAIVSSFRVGQARWFRGYLLTGDER
jgi:hypothetical protein